MLRLTSATFALLAVLAAGARAWPAEAQPSEATDVHAPPAPVPVQLRTQPLFWIAAPLGKLDPTQRAARIQRRLDDLVNSSAEVVNEVRAVDHEDRTDVVAGDRLIMSVTDADARPTGRTRRQLASDDAQLLREALGRDFRERSFRGLLFGALYAMIATLAFALTLWAHGRGFRHLYVLLQRISSKRFGQRMKALVAGGMGEVLVVLARLVRVLSFGVILYVYVDITLSFFPWSRGVAHQLFHYLASTVLWIVRGIWAYLPNCVSIAVILAVTRYVVKFARLVFEGLDRGALRVGGFYPDWALPTYKIVRFLIFAFAAVLIFPYLPGSSSPAFRGVSVFVGLLLSLGSASSVGNVISGLVITYMRPFQTGDRVKVADTVGDVISKNLLVVRVRTIKNVEVTIPNAIVLANHIVNYSAGARENGLILHAGVTIGYDAPWRKVHELLIAAARATAGVLASPAPFVLQTALDDFYVHYEINAYTEQAASMANIYSDLYANIQDQFNRGAVEIMSPHYVSARDGNRTAIPDEYLPKSYRTPSFRLFKTGDEGSK